MLEILLIAREESLIEKIRGLKAGGTDISFRVTANLPDAQAFVANENIRLVLIHVAEDVDDEAVCDLIHSAARGSKPTPVLVLADAYHDQQAISFFRSGAADYLALPLDFAKLSFLVDVLTLRFQPALKPIAAPLPRTSGKGKEAVNYIVAPEIAEMMGQVRRVAPQDITVLITGETGTGKTRLARLIHQMSPRHDKPFMIVDCAALTGSLIESEMFGHVKGAFTGADSERQGKLGAAGEGTLLLDEINALPLSLQGKLLRAVEERVFEPVGSNRSVPMHARIIAVSNVPLEAEVAAARFRVDLFYRLNVAGFFLPPLRDRATAIPPLCNKFLAEFISRNRPDITGTSPEVIKVLQEYDWPGNIRELRNVIERAVALARGPIIQLQDLPEAVLFGGDDTMPQQPTQPMLELAGKAAAGDGTLSQARDEVEIHRIQAALHKFGNNRSRAAAELGISRMGLYKKLHKYGFIDSGTV